MKQMLIKSALWVVGGLSVAASQTGCASHAGTGALVGGGAGAGIGAIIGHNSHGRTAEGALIGGAVGAIAGGLVGDAQDREERESSRYDNHYDRGYESRSRYYESGPPSGSYYEYRSVQRGPYGGYSEYREYRY